MLVLVGMAVGRGLGCPGIMHATSTGGGVGIKVGILVRIKLGTGVGSNDGCVVGILVGMAVGTK